MVCSIVLFLVLVGVIVCGGIIFSSSLLLFVCVVFYSFSMCCFCLMCRLMGLLG